MLILMDIMTLGIDPGNGSPMLILKEHSGDRVMALPLSSQDVSSIAIKSLDVASDRPLTIDLVKLVQIGRAHV